MGAMKHAKMPEEFCDRTLGSLTVGETAWTMPWALWVDSERDCWVDPNMIFQDHSSGCTIKVTREIGGFEVELKGCNYRWTITHGYKPGIKVKSLVY